MENDKPLVWIKGEIKTPPFSGDARIQAGTLLRRIQKGEILTTPHSKPLPNIGKQCHELRINDSKSKIEWRIIYHICSEAIIILDTFEKKSNKTPKAVITKCQNRLKQFYSFINED